MSKCENVTKEQSEYFGNIWKKDPMFFMKCENQFNYKEDKIMCDSTKNTIAVDFDGVIHKYSKGWDDGSIYDKPVEGVHKALMELMNDYWVYIFTTRSVGAVKDWMNGQFWGAREMGFGTIAMPEGIMFWQGGKGNEIAVSNRKLPAEFYIDDRGIRFNGNWEETLKKIREIRKW